MSLKRVNLNLIPVLREVLQLRSITGAARALGRSPPAVSEALAQLRSTLDDPLIVRTGGKMVLTPRAIDLIGPVEMACAQLEDLFQLDRFDPLTLNRQFVVAAHDYHVFHFGPGLLALFREAAPGFSLRFVELAPDTTERMLAREIDFALMPELHLGQLLPAQLRHTGAVGMEMAVILRDGHPLAGRTGLTEADLMAFPHVAFHPSWETGDQNTALTRYRRIFRVVARVPHIMLLPHFVTGTDNVAIVPIGLALRLPQELGLTWCPLDMDYPGIDTTLAWSAVQDADPAHQWFRMQAGQILTLDVGHPAGDLHFGGRHER